MVIGDLNPVCWQLDLNAGILTTNGNRLKKYTVHIVTWQLKDENSGARRTAIAREWPINTFPQQ
jgi:hypothetical protein